MPTDDLPARVTKLESTQAEHARILQQFRSDISEIRNYLGNTATKADVAAMGTQITGAINGVLKDALHSVPAKHIVWLVGILVGASILGTFLIAHVVH